MSLAPLARAALPPVAYVLLVSWATEREWAARAVWHRLHSVALALYSLAATATVAVHWATVQGPAVCAAVAPLPRWLLVSWYASKLWEWIDTVILVARRRPVSRLHFVHHMITPSIVAVQELSATTHTPLLVVGTATNAFAHVLMYAHYASPWPPAARRWITRVQVAQHALMVVLLVHSLTIDGCTRDRTHNLFPLACYAFFLWEFGSLLTRG